MWYSILPKVNIAKGTVYRDLAQSEIMVHGPCQTIPSKPDGIDDTFLYYIIVHNIIIVH